MSATSDPHPPATAWPPARPSGISPIQHPAWEEARNAILDLAAAGPVTAIIVGEPGTGKSWLLRELASALGDHGFPTMMLMQGNLPMTLADGAALLVDDASLMAEPTRAELSAQQRGVVILAGAEWFEDELESASTTQVVIRLRTLLPDEIADFAGQWLQRSGLSDSAVGPGLLARLTSNSGGRVGTVVQLLGEAAASWQNFPILTVGAPQPTVAAIVPESEPEPPAASMTRPPARSGRRVYLSVAGASAIAAGIALGWALRTTPPVPVQADTVALALPPLHPAELPRPALATASVPQMDAATIPVETETPSTAPVIAAAPPPDLLTPADPTLVANLDDPLPSMPPRTGGPGLALIAQRGDTLESLYGDVYRDRRAPPFSIVLAANPRPFRPGSIVVFPEPPGGWQRVQR